MRRAQSLKQVWTQATVGFRWARVLQHLGNYQAANDRLLESLRIFRRQGADAWVGRCFAELAASLSALHENDAAALLLGAAEAVPGATLHLWESTSGVPALMNRSDSQFVAGRRKGQSLALEQAIEYATRYASSGENLTGP